MDNFLSYSLIYVLRYRQKKLEGNLQSIAENIESVQQRRQHLQDKILLLENIKSMSTEEVMSAELPDDEAIFLLTGRTYDFIEELSSKIKFIKEVYFSGKENKNILKNIIFLIQYILNKIEHLLIRWYSRGSGTVHFE